MISQACHFMGIWCTLLFISNITGVSYSFPNTKNLDKNETRINHCRSWEFQCKSGQCVAKPFVCDGLKDCNDYSDENYDQCRNKTSIKCKEEQFQCQYGACIEKKYLCDGQKHCRDESDESSDTCNVLRNQLNKKRNRRDADKSCAALIASPDKTINYDCDANMSSGTCGPINGFVPRRTIAIVTCAPGYHQDNPEIGSVHVCFNSQWSPKVGKCVKKCDQLKPVNHGLLCNRYGVNIGNCNGSSELLAGTEVIPTCEPAYKYYPPSYDKITCNNDGKWDNNLVPCVPECGKPYYADVQLTIAGGTPESIGGSPWHVAIFNKDELLICGGTIISEILVLSAAHCFGDGTECQGTTCIEDYEVVVGKFTRNYTVKDNSYQKTMKIKEIRYSTVGYRGLTTYFAADVVILILKEKIPLSSAILPACVNWDALEKKKYPLENKPGKVVGWGTTENDTSRTVLRSIDLPFISYQRCVDMVDDDFKVFVTIDKFCAGTRDPTGLTVQPGDSGGGLLFGEKDLFYLRGVVSIKQRSSNAVSLFTDLSHYVDWIASVRDEVEEKVPKNRIQSTLGSNLLTISQTSDANTVEDPLTNEIVRDIQSNNFSLAQSKLQQGTNDTYNYIVKKVYSQPINNFELLLRFADYVHDYEQKFKLYENIRNGIKKSNNQHTAWQLQQLSKSFKKEILERAPGDIAAQNLSNALQNELQKASAILIAAAFRNDILWPVAKLASAEIYHNCDECITDIYKEVIEIVWNKVTIDKLLEKARNELENIREVMAHHTALFNKLQQTGTLTYVLAAKLAFAIKTEMDKKNYNSVQQVKRTNYEELFSTVKMAMREGTVGPISAAFQNDTSWPTAQLKSDNIHYYCHACVVDIYKAVVDNIWNKVTIQDILHKARNNLKIKFGEAFAVHKAIMNKLKLTDTLNASSTALLASFWKETMDAAVKHISAAFQNDTSWYDARRVNADMNDNCKECMPDIYREVVETVWNKVTIKALLKKAQNELEYAREVMALHTAIFNKLQQTDALTPGLAVKLASAIKAVMNMSKYEDVEQGERTSYEEIFSTVNNPIREAAIKQISTSFQNDTLWPIAQQLSANISENCHECMVDIYSEVFNNVWNKVTIRDILRKARNNFKNFGEAIAVHKAMINKLKLTDTLNASTTALLASFMNETTDAAVRLISDTFQNDTSWPTVRRLNADIYDTCDECFADIYKEVVETLWNKVGMQEVLQKTRNELENIQGVMALHTAIFKKLHSTGTLTPGLAAKIAFLMKYHIKQTNYKMIQEATLAKYKELFTTVKVIVREAAVGPISAAFQNDTSWPIARQLSANIQENCHDCVVDIYEEVFNNIWNKVTIQDLLHKAQNHLQNFGEALVVHKAIIYKLTHPGIINASSAASLNSFVLATQGAAAGVISAAFQNDVFWPSAQHVIADIYNICEGCMMEIHKKVVEKVWNKVDTHELLRKAENNLNLIFSIMAVHTAVFNKLKPWDTSNADLAADLASRMKNVIDMPNYGEVGRYKRIDYEALFNTMNMTVREIAIGPISDAFQNDTSWPTAQRLSTNIYDYCTECIVDIYNKVFTNIWNKVTVQDILRKARNNLKKFGEAIIVHKAVTDKLKRTDTFNSSSKASLNNFMKESMDTAVGLISAAFQGDTSWQTAGNVSVDIYNNCKECMPDVYKDVVETVWNKVTIQELLGKARNEFEYIQEVMALHTAIFNKLNETSTLTTSSAAKLASWIEVEINLSTYEEVEKVERTKYEKLFSTVKMIIREAAVGPISAAFQNDTSWSTAQRVSADIYENCNECLVDIYQEVVETVWNKVPIQDLLNKIRNNLEQISESMAVHTAIFNKLQQTSTLTAGLAAKLAYWMKFNLDLPNYVLVQQVERANYEELFTTVKETIREAAVGPISAAFQNDTSWPIAQQLSANINENCHECAIDIYNEILDNVWNNVTIPDLLRKARDNLKNYGEAIAVHKAIINKLKRADTLNASSTASLTSFMKVTMDTAAGQISTAFQNDIFWPTAQHVSADIHNSCDECMVDIYKKAVETVWNKVPIQDLLHKTQNNLKQTSEMIAVHTAIFDKLQQTGSFNTGLAAALASFMKVHMNSSDYAEAEQVMRTNYKELFSRVKMTIRKSAVEPISASFQNDTSWVTARQLSANISENCHECIVDIYNEVVDNVWNKVTIQDVLRRAGKNLKNFGEAVAVHTAIIRKLNRTGTSNSSSTASLRSFMKQTMDAAAGQISAAFQNDTFWPTALRVSVDIYVNCNECIVDIYKKVVETVWNKVTTPELQKKARMNLKKMEEIIAVHTAIFNKLYQIGILTTTSAANLAFSMKDVMDSYAYHDVPKVNQTNYEALYNTVKMRIRKAAVGPISAAFQNDTSWSIVRQLSADIYKNCHECVVDIYNEAFNNIWNKVTVQNLLHKARNNLKNYGVLMVIYKAIYNKLEDTNTLNATLKHLLTRFMTEAIDRHRDGYYE